MPSTHKPRTDKRPHSRPSSALALAPSTLAERARRRALRECLVRRMTLRFRFPVSAPPAFALRLQGIRATHPSPPRTAQHQYSHTPSSSGAQAPCIPYRSWSSSSDVLVAGSPQSPGAEHLEGRNSCAVVAGAELVVFQYVVLARA